MNHPCVKICMHQHDRARDEQREEVIGGVDA